MVNIWQKLKKPILVMAPMDDVTDFVFRQIIAETAPPDIYFTEFTNCDALFSAGRENHIKRLKFNERQRPIIAQIWGANPENYHKTARLINEMGFDGIDINMGCPDKAIRRSGSCSALIDNPGLAGEIIAATKEGASGLAVSVKTRLGVKKINTVDWLGFLLEQDIAALIVHGRTVKEMSKTPAHWDEIAKAVSLRDSMQKDTLIIGNGDIISHDQAVEYSRKYNVDGVMIGRGIFENLWIFDPGQNSADIPLKDKLALLKKHVFLFHHTWGYSKNPDLMKKFLKVYISGFYGASNMRKQLMESKSLPELTDKINTFLQQK